MAAKRHDDLPDKQTRVETVGRIKRDVIVDGEPFWTLFDTGAVNTFVTEEVASHCVTLPAPTRLGVRLGGQVHQIDQLCALVCLVEGLPIHTLAQVLREIGPDENGRPIQILLGALAMQQWRIIPIPEEERLDMTHYPHTFVEF